MDTDDALIEQFNRLKADTSLDDEARYAQMDKIAERLISFTIDCYNNTADQYKYVRTEINPFNKLLWDIFTGAIAQNFNHDQDDMLAKSRIKILDIGASGARDIIHGQKLGYDMYGSELPDAFLKGLDVLHAEGKIKHKVRKCDMREIDYDDAFFDVVRHNTTLLHMPVIGKGYGADKALAEAYRVLKHNGLLWVIVKEGEPQLVLHNTKEGLGDRLFQLFSMDLLCEVIKRNGFEILLEKKMQSNRPTETIDFLVVIARKVVNRLELSELLRQAEKPLDDFIKND